MDYVAWARAQQATVLTLQRSVVPRGHDAERALKQAKRSRAKAELAQRHLIQTLGLKAEAIRRWSQEAKEEGDRIGKRLDEASPVVPAPPEAQMATSPVEPLSQQAVGPADPRLPAEQEREFYEMWQAMQRRGQRNCLLFVVLLVVIIVVVLRLALG